MKWLGFFSFKSVLFLYSVQNIFKNQNYISICYSKNINYLKFHKTVKSCEKNESNKTKTIKKTASKTKLEQFYYYFREQIYFSFVAFFKSSPPGIFILFIRIAISLILKLPVKDIKTDSLFLFDSTINIKSSLI